MFNEELSDLEEIYQSSLRELDDRQREMLGHLVIAMKAFIQVYEVKLETESRLNRLHDKWEDEDDGEED